MWASTPWLLPTAFWASPTRCGTWVHLGETGVDENAGILFGYKSGVLAMLTTSVRANTSHIARISGSEGEIVINERWWGDSFTLRRDGCEAQEIRPETVGNGWNYEAIEAGRCWRVA